MNKKLFVICLAIFALGFALMYFNQSLLFLIGMAGIVLFAFGAGPRLGDDGNEERFKKDQVRLIKLMWISAFYVSSGIIALFFVV
ncbi:hypothetical protein [Marinilactibacillus kalidii]|uniref:hypothetical protein n=1 Tax=Marinilactibacillus kalidii TaxID=2820274 RepID=UPI001ABE4F1C|nr:hypothetical protein [Marinilactibacillus kalidii]